MKEKIYGGKEKRNRLTNNQKFLLRMQTFPNRAVRVVMQMDAQGQVVSAVFEDVGKVEKFG